MRELSMHILDLAQNSIVVEAKHIDIEVAADTRADKLTITLKDDGWGMPPDMVEAVRSPFVTTRTTRRIGLGIPMMAEAAEACDGSLDLRSEVGVGTTLTATFKLSHIDRVPMGDTVGTMIALIASNPDISFKYTQRVDDKEFVLDTEEIKAQLDGVPINENAVLKWLADYVKEGTSGEMEIE